MNLDHDSLHDPKQFIIHNCKDFSYFFVWKMTSNNASLLVTNEKDNVSNDSNIQIYIP